MISASPELVASLCRRKVTSISLVDDEYCSVVRPLHTRATLGLAGTEWVKAQLVHSVRLASIGEDQDIRLRKLIVLHESPMQAQQIADSIYDLSSDYLRTKILNTMLSLRSQIASRSENEDNPVIHRSLLDQLAATDLAIDILEDKNRSLLVPLGPPHSRQVWPPALVGLVATVVASTCLTLALWFLVLGVWHQRQAGDQWEESFQ